MRLCCWCSSGQVGDTVLRCMLSNTVLCAPEKEARRMPVYRMRSGLGVGVRQGMRVMEWSWSPRRLGCELGYVAGPGRPGEQALPKVSPLSVDVVGRALDDPSLTQVPSIGNERNKAPYLLLGCFDSLRNDLSEDVGVWRSGEGRNEAFRVSGGSVNYRWRRCRFRL